MVLCTSATPGIGWLADFAGSTTLKVREEAAVDWSENTYDPNALGDGDGASDFERNMIRFRCEGRFGFAVTRPAGVVKVSLAAAQPMLSPGGFVVLPTRRHGHPGSSGGLLLTFNRRARQGAPSRSRVPQTVIGQCHGVNNPRRIPKLLRGGRKIYFDRVVVRAVTRVTGHLRCLSWA